MNKETQISLFTNCKTDDLQNCTVQEVIEGISETFKAFVEPVRSAANPEQYKQAKENLPALTWSGVFDGGHKLENLRRYTNIICLDIDHVEKPEEMKDRIKTIDFVAYCFLSPSGKGLKVIVALKENELVNKCNEDLAGENRKQALECLDRYHKTQFAGLVQYFSENHAIAIDQSGKDISRLCFISHDTNTYQSAAPICRNIVPITEEVTVLDDKPVKRSPAIAILASTKQQATLPLNLTDDTNKWSAADIVWRLGLIPSNDYALWLKIGWCLHDYFNGSEEGFQIFVEWSKKSSKFDSMDKCRQLVWSTAKNNTSNPVTIGTFNYIYKEAVAEFYDSQIFADTDRKGELYGQYVSLKNKDGYLCLLRDGYKPLGIGSIKESLHEYFVHRHILPRIDAIKFVIKNLHLVKDVWPYVSVLEKGIHEFNGELHLVENTPAQVSPCQGNWSNIQHLIETTMPEKDWQWLFSRLQLDLKGFMARDMQSKGHAMFIIGQKLCGKSTIAMIIQRLLGGKSASVSDYIMQKRFNREMLMYPFWIIDDTLNRTNGVGTQTCHEKFKELIKLSTVQESPVFEKKFGDVVTMNNGLFRRLVITLNNEKEILELLPDNSDDISDKYSLLSCEHSFQSEDFDRQLLWQELPAFAWFLLNEWQRPTWIEHDVRLGIKAYHNPDIQKMIFAASSENDLLLDIENILGKSNLRKIEGTANEIYNELANVVQQKDLDMRHRPFGRMDVSKFSFKLRRMKRDLPLVVSNSRTKDCSLWSVNLDGIKESIRIGLENF